MPLIANAQMTVAAAPGTGTVTLGAATPGAQTWAAAGAANGGVYSYRIEEGSKWEIGSGTYTASGTTLARTTILASSNGNAAETFGAAAIVSQIALPGDIQTPLGFTPVQQGGGIKNDGYTHKLFLSWDGARPRITVDATDVGQFAMLPEFVASFTGSGYQKLPNGFIVQWIRTQFANAADYALTWPIAFPNALLSIAGGLEVGDTAAGSLYALKWDSVSNSGANIRCRVASGGTVTTSTGGIVSLILVGW